jgi:dihydroorotate dehydrogenase (fumarate)
MTVDLHTNYLGLRLRNPLVVSACPMADDLDRLRRLADAGVAAAVFPSLFEEQIEQEELEIHGLYELGVDSFAESLSYFPELADYNVGPERYLKRLEETKAAVDIPIIGSLNGTTSGGWVRYARLIAEAGADAIELNVYSVPADPELTAAEVEVNTLELVEAVRAEVTIPLAVKIVPFYTSFANMAQRLVAAGANGLVLFNRFVHPDIDLETLRVVPDLVLSQPVEMRLPLMWIGLLRGHINASLAATSGVHSHADVLKLLLVGADVTMLASTLYLHGPGHVETMLDGMSAWLEDREYASVEQMKGSLSQEHSPDPAAFERVGYMKTLASFSSPRHR